MSGDILQSLLLDNSRATCGLPFCATGEQPAFPEGTESLIPKLPTGALEPLIQKLNKVFKDTGSPFLPLGLLWLVFIASMLLNFEDFIGKNGMLSFKIVGICCGLVWAIPDWICAWRRRKNIVAAIQQWNDSDGQTYGVHVDISGKDGAKLSPCRFRWSKVEIFLHVFDGPGEADIGCCFAV